MSSDIFAELASGVHDGKLDQLAEAVRQRRKYVSNQRGLANKAELSAGDKVVIHSGISPKYLIGITGVVSARPAGRRAGDIMVDIDEEHQYKMGRFGMSVGVPAACLRKL